MLAAGTDLGAAREGIPGRLSPFNVGFTCHSYLQDSIGTGQKWHRVLVQLLGRRRMKLMFVGRRLIRPGEKTHLEKKPRRVLSPSPVPLGIA